MTDGVTAIVSPAGALAAVLGAVVAISAQLLRERFTNKRDQKIFFEKQIKVSRLLRIELINLSLHLQANIKSLEGEAKLKKDSGKSENWKLITFERLRYSEHGLMNLEPSDVYMLDERLASDIIWLPLYLRNNELHINRAIDVLFSRQFGLLKYKTATSRSNKINVDYRKDLIERFKRTIEKSDKLAGYLLNYSLDPQNYVHPGLNWEKDKEDWEPASSPHT